MPSMLPQVFSKHKVEVYRTTLSRGMCPRYAWRVACLRDAG